MYKFLLILSVLLLSIGIFPITKFQVHGVKPAIISKNIIDDGEFVYYEALRGQNFDSEIKSSLPNLFKNRKLIYENAEIYSINPKILITFLKLEGINEKSKGLSYQKQNELIEGISLNLATNFYKYIDFKVENDPKKTPMINVSGDSNLTYSPSLNASSFALFESSRDKALFNEVFNSTHKVIFPEDDLFAQKNKLDYEIISGKNTQSSRIKTSMQFPYPIGTSWVFNGAHSTNMSGIDFAPSAKFPSWGSNTSNMWAVAVADGVATKVSNCLVYINHGGGWETKYYHVENVQFSGSKQLRANDRVANLANTFREATCNGGSATGVHLHLNLKHNGAYVRLDGARFTEWIVNSKTNVPYSTNCSYMFLSKGSVKRCPYSFILNDAKVNSCSPSSGSDWIIDAKNCSVSTNQIVSKNLIIRNGGSLDIINGGSIDMDLKNYNIQIDKSSRLYIDKFSKIH